MRIVRVVIFARKDQKRVPHGAGTFLAVQNSAMVASSARRLNDAIAGARPLLVTMPHAKIVHFATTVNQQTISVTSSAAKLRARGSGNLSRPRSIVSDFATTAQFASGIVHGLWYPVSFQSGTQSIPR
mmetsp:Transcript_31581/g.35904  ORF Transcript_31581/g.35904 Transcript_31581/m.35904 type:complete len:128 (-) Transcript_31581:222-605(-)